MEPYVFAGNRRRWRYLRPFIGAATVGVGLWLAALCWVLLKSPALPSLDLGASPSSVLARVGTPLARGLGQRSRWAVR